MKNITILFSAQKKVALWATRACCSGCFSNHHPISRVQHNQSHRQNQVKKVLAPGKFFSPQKCQGHGRIEHPISHRFAVFEPANSPCIKTKHNDRQQTHRQKICKRLAHVVGNPRTQHTHCKHSKVRESWSEGRRECGRVIKRFGHSIVSLYRISLAIILAHNKTKKKASFKETCSLILLEAHTRSNPEGSATCS